MRVHLAITTVGSEYDFADAFRRRDPFQRKGLRLDEVLGTILVYLYPGEL